MHTEYAFDTPEPIRLVVENARGTVTVTAADVTTTKVDIDGRRAEEVRVEQRGDAVHVLAPQPRGIGRDNQLDLRIAVPSGSDLHSRTGSADLAATGSYGASSIKSGSGQVHVERIGRTAVVDTGSGDVTIDDLTAEARLRSGSGDIRLGHTAAVTAVSTGSGDVRVGTSDGVLVVKTGSGDLTVDRAGTDVTLTTGSGDFGIGTASAGRVSLKGASGDLRIGIPEGTAVWTDVCTASGRVHSSVASVGEPEPGAPYVEVRATTASGDIELVSA